MLALLGHLHLNLIAKRDLIYHWNIPLDRYPLVALGIRGLEHGCARSGEPVDRPFDAVSTLSDFSTEFPRDRLINQADRFERMVKQFRFDARNPAVSHCRSTTILPMVRDN